MDIAVIYGLLIPFAGTVLGSACVFFMRGSMNEALRKALTGFAAGVMVAASVWSLLIPALEQSEGLGSWSFLPAAAGFWLGILFLLLLDHLVPHLHMDNTTEGPQSSLKRTTMLVLAVTLHNIPEGMAVGVVFAGWVTGSSGITATAALALALGIAIQNFPEGAIISMPLMAGGKSRGRALLYGIASGIVEPIAAGLTLILFSLVSPALQYLLAMLLGVLPTATFTIHVLNSFKRFFIYLHFYRMYMKVECTTSLSHVH